MRITPIAAASLIPATIAGVAFTIMPFVNGTAAAATRAPAPAAAHSTAHLRAAPPRPRATTQHTTAPASVHPAATQPAVAAAQAAPQQPAAPQMSAADASFETCVAWRESGDNPTASSAGMFGILPATWAQLGFPGTAGQSSVALQTVAFDKLYHELGTQPWGPYDGC